jgi:tetratricopeptide (TPR) repeat protein
MDITKYDVLINCPNDHPVHDVCLKEWITHSKNCPVCSTQYTLQVTDSFKDYLDQKEKDALAEIEAQKRKEMEEKVEKIAEQIAFKKVLESIESLAENKQYDDAIDRLFAFDEKSLSPFKLQNILFLKGKIFLMMEKYDMAINNLFNLVKNQNFEYPDAFLYLGKAYEALGLTDKAKWAYDRIPK